MLKQKNPNFKKNYINKYKKNKKSKFLKLSSTRDKSYLKLRKILKYKAYLTNTTFQTVANANNLKNFSKQINIRITPNNVFCSLRNITKNKTIFVTSSGKCNTKTSKKVLRYSSKIITQTFFDKIKQKI